jgi:ferrous iron transport protein B
MKSEDHAPTQRLRIALIGTPNCGKTTLFNALTGLKHRVGNFAGVTVEYALGSFKVADGSSIDLIDLPGVNGLIPFSSDEAVSVDILLSNVHEQRPDQLWIVADLDGARRSLLLAGQLRDLGYPCALIFNRLDHASEAAADALCMRVEAEWGIPAVAVSAKSLKRLDRLAALPFHAVARPNAKVLFTDDQWAELQSLKPTDPPYKTYHLLVAQDSLDALPSFSVASARTWVDRELAVRLETIDRLFGHQLAQLRDSTRPAQQLTRRLDRWLLHPLVGPIAMVLCLMLVFQVLFTLSAAPMEWVDGVMAQVGGWMHAKFPDVWWSRLLVDGLWSGMQGVLVFIPQIALLFTLVALLEESGYMARLVSWLDRPMQRLGISGKSATSLLGGFACAVPSIMLVRSLPNRRQRLLTILLVPFMSCSARLPVYVVLIAVLIPDPKPFLGLDVRAWCLAGAYLAGPLIGLLFIQLVAYGFGPRPKAQLLITELPTYKMPTLQDVLTTVWDRCKVFVLEAGRVILVVSMFLWFLAQYGPPGEREVLVARYVQNLEAHAGDSAKLALLELEYNTQLLESSWAGVLGRSFEPVIAPLGYDWRIGVALLTSFAAREVFVGTMNTLFAVGNADDENYTRLVDRLRKARRSDSDQPLFNLASVVSLLLFYALALQCMSTLAVMRRELGGWSLTFLSLGWHTALAWLAAFAAWQLLS